VDRTNPPALACFIRNESNTDLTFSDGLTVGIAGLLSLIGFVRLRFPLNRTNLISDLMGETKVMEPKRQVLTELWVIESQQGDEDAFRKLHDLWSADFLRIATVRLGNAAEAREVVQDAWIQIAKKIGTLREAAAFPKWSFRILFVCAVNFQRKAMRKRTVPTISNCGLELDSLPAQQQEETDDAAASRVRRAITQLPAPAQELLHLHYGANLPLQAIADLLVVPVGTVKSRLYSTREQLKHIIQNDTI
jgi:RNA polymerase sigma factor (sigma-70 family)